MYKRPLSSSDDRSPLSVGVGSGSVPRHFASAAPTAPGNGHHQAPRYVVTTNSGCLRSVLRSFANVHSDGAGGSGGSSSNSSSAVDLDALVSRIIRLCVFMVGIAVSIVYYGGGFDISRTSLENHRGDCFVGTSSSSSRSSVAALPSPPPQSLIDSRTKRWEDEEEEQCRFPTFTNSDETFYNMTKGAFWLEYGDELRKGHFRYRLQYGRDRHSETLQKKMKKAREAGKRSISFVHIGKAGGSSMLCHMRGVSEYAYHCPGWSSRTQSIKGFPRDGDEESEIGKLINCYVHYDFRIHCFDNPTLLLNVRSPVDRLGSWYHYEHIENMKILWKDRIKSCGQQMLFKCYNKFFDLAEFGLAGTRPPPTKLLRVERDPNEETCRHWAWATVQGTAPASFHNVWNFDWFGSPAIAFDREIIALRTKHLEKDWRKVDIMLGGKGTVPSKMHMNDASTKDLPVNNKTVSEQGRLNLCRALCHEIQVYKQILVAAVNLDEADVMDSLKELNCPDDMSPEVRFCPQSYIDYQI